jgi:hypothetical protein
MTDMSDIAIKAEQDLNTYRKKQGVGKQSISGKWRRGSTYYSYRRCLT